MPNERTLNEKKKIVEELTDKLKYQSGVFVNYSGITVNEDTALRVKLREANVDYSVIKNTLIRFAAKNVGFEELEPIFQGTTSLAVSKDDAVAPARIIKEHADKFVNYFEIKGGFLDGKILSVDEVNALASIPPLPILRAQLLGTMLAPIAKLAIVINAIAEKNGAPAEKATEEVPVVAEIPVEEVAEAVVEEVPVVAEVPAEEVAEAVVEETPVVAEVPVEEAAEVAAAEEVLVPEESVAAETPVEEAAEVTAAEEVLAPEESVAAETPEETANSEEE